MRCSRWTRCGSADTATFRSSTAGAISGMVSIRDLYEAVRLTLEEELRSAELLIYGEQYGATAT